MLPLICFLLHPSRLNAVNIIRQSVRQHVYYTGAEKSFYPVVYAFIKSGVGVWVRRGAFIGVFWCMHTQ